MSQYEAIKDRLQRTPILAADGERGEVRLIGEDAAFRLMVDGGRAHLLMNAEGAIKRFAKLEGLATADRIFKREEIAKIAGVPPSTVYLWLQRGVLVPSVRESCPGAGMGPEYSWADAFVAGIVGSLRRQGLGQDVLCKVQPLFVKSKEKRTAKKGQASTRS